MQLSNADIIGFQEVRLSEGKGDVLGPNQVEHLATYLREYNVTSTLLKYIQYVVASTLRLKRLVQKGKLIHT